MSIRYKFFFAFSVLVALACALAFFGFRSAEDSRDRVVRMYDGPLMAINHARSAHSALNEARVLLQSNRSSDGFRTIRPFTALLQSIFNDFDIVGQRVNNADVSLALSRAIASVQEWSNAELAVIDPPPGGLTEIPAPFSIEHKRKLAVAAVDDLVEAVAGFGFEYRLEAANAVKASSRELLALSAGTVLIGLLLAVVFAKSMSAPILVALQFAERISAGKLTNQIEVNRSDELGRLQRALLVMQTSLKYRADEDQQNIARFLFLAQHDRLTGLSNREQFTCMIDNTGTQRDRETSAFSVFVLDLNRFKIINDTFGHPLGDELLKQVGARLKAAAGNNDVVARLGGDEFAIFQAAEPSNQREAALELAHQINEMLSFPFDLLGHTVTVGASIGIALAPSHGSLSSELLMKADLALYDAKAGRGRRTAIFDLAMLEVAEARRTTESELRGALERNEFELYYQPLVDAKTQKICAVEALVRWHHPQKGLVAPDGFVSLAEETGLIVPIGEWILGRACADATALPEDITVAVNISAVQFARARLFDVVMGALIESGLKPSRLELEITETVLLENEHEFLNTIRQLKALGITITLDDFGTGYSSLSYLTKFPFDRLKIDRSFTQGIAKRADYDAVILSVLTLARGLGIETTAEGVETEDQASRLRDAGVDVLQGYLFGRPVPVEKLEFSSGPGFRGPVEIAVVA